MKVAEIMTIDVVAVTPETSLKEVAELLTTHGISGAPVVDAEGRVLGVVSEADVIAKERRPPQFSAWQRLVLDIADAKVKAAARTVGEAMTAPAVTITPDRRVDHAASLMLDRQVNRLPVVNRDSKLVGIVTRADLVRAFLHTDEALERQILDEVLLHELWLNPDEFRVSVDGGEVTVEADAQSDAERDLVVRRIGLVPGVVSVEVRTAARVG